MQKTADLVTFTEEILNGKLHFFVQCVWGSIELREIFSPDSAIAIAILFYVTRILIHLMLIVDQPV